MLSCNLPSAINSLTASSAASWRAAFLLGAEASENRFSPTLTRYMNLNQERGREKHPVRAETYWGLRHKQRDADPVNKGFILPEPADYTLRMQRKAVEGLGRCQLTLVTTEGAELADH